MAFTAYDGREAVEKFERENPKPSIVIIRLPLPDSQVTGGCHETNDIDAAYICIIFISGDESVRHDLLDAGATVFLKKPDVHQRYYSNNKFVD